MPGLEEIFTEYIVEPLQKALGGYTPDTSTPELPSTYDISTTSRLSPDFDPYSGMRFSTIPSQIPRNLPVYRGDEKTGELETLPNPRFDARSPIKSHVRYWHQTGDIAADYRGRGDIDYHATPALKNMYAYARMSGAAKQLGLPSVDPDQFAAMVLKEGRPDMGFNAFQPKAKPDLEFREKLDAEYNIPEWQKDFLGLLNYSDRIAKKRGVPFEAVWNGLGTNFRGQTGFDYAEAMDTHRKAVLHPKNAEFRNFVQRAFADGAEFGLPRVEDKARDTDPYLESDPEYEYHTPEGRLKPHGINTLFKASGGVVIDDGNPAKRRKLI